jgi:hypothetical protein
VRPGSILHRTHWRRGNATSQEHLRQWIESFVSDFNPAMAKPFGWSIKRQPHAACEDHGAWISDGVYSSNRQARSNRCTFLVIDQTSFPEIFSGGFFSGRGSASTTS